MKHGVAPLAKRRIMPAKAIRRAATSLTVLQVQRQALLGLFAKHHFALSWSRLETGAEIPRLAVFLGVESVLAPNQKLSPLRQRALFKLGQLLCSQDAR